MSVEEIKARNIRNVVREAKRLFAQLGVERTSVGMVADAAKITRRSVINYFESKNTLISAIEEELVQESSDGLNEYLAKPEYAAMTGKEQILGVTGYVLGSLKTMYSTANVLTEIATILRHDVELENRKDTAYAVNIVSSALTPAYDKGVKDGSINPNSALCRNDGELFTLLLRGLYRQLAFILECGEEHDKAYAESISADFITLVDKILSCPA